MTVPLAFQLLLRDQARYIVANGFDLTLVCAPGDEMVEFARDVGARYIPLSMKRQPAPISDSLAVATMTRLFQRERFDLIHSSTPKAGMITMISGAISRVPYRLHTFTGQPWVELSGAKRIAALNADRIVTRLATHLYVDSVSQRDFLVAQRIAEPRDLKLLGAGSLRGVDLRQYDPAALASERIAVRERLRIGSNTCVIAFLGRITRDKGVWELVDAFRLLGDRSRDVALFLIGPNDVEGGGVSADSFAELAGHPGIHVMGFVPRPEVFLAAADIFCLPSYRESFGLSIIEASAMGLPVVATRITGIIDAVAENQTGLLVPAKDVQSLADALERLIGDPAARRRLGDAGRARARALFDSNVINGLVVAEYRRLLEST